MLDIQTLAKLALPTVNKRDLEGLSKLCVRLLEGVALDKSQQISPWHQRPLTEAQMIYAGLDAWALVQLFDSVIRLLKDGTEGNIVCTSIRAGAGATSDGSTMATISTSTAAMTSTKKKRNKLSGVTVEDSMRKVVKQYHLALPMPYQDFMVLPESVNMEMSGTDMSMGIYGVDTTVGVNTKPFSPLKSIRMEEKNMPKDWTYRYTPINTP